MNLREQIEKWDLRQTSEAKKYLNKMGMTMGEEFVEDYNKAMQALKEAVEVIKGALSNGRHPMTSVKYRHYWLKKWGFECEQA